MSVKKSVFDIFQTSRDDEENGKWFPLGYEIKVQLRRFSSKKSQAARKALVAPYKRPGQMTENLPDEVGVQITNRQIADAIIVNWSGVFGSDGKEIPFSPDAAYELLEALPDFAVEIVSLAVSMDNFRKDKDAAISGN